MGMSDCVKCWDTPCRCGHDYKDWSEQALKDQIEMLQGVLNMKRLMAFRKESDLDVVLQPNLQIVGRYHDMVMHREKERLINFDTAKIHDSGFILEATTSGDLTRVQLVDSGGGYIMPTAVWAKLEVMIGERVHIILHHKLYRIVKAKVPLGRPAKTKSIHTN